MSAPQDERTFTSVKSEGIQRRLIGEVIHRFERRGLKLVACKLAIATREKVEKLYPDDEAWYENCGRKTLEGYQKRGKIDNRSPREIGIWVRGKLIKELVGRPILAMVWQGAHAVELGRKTVGITNALEAAPGTIRGDFSTDSYMLADLQERPVRTIVHASGSKEEAEKDISIWFGEEEIVTYPLLEEEILYGDGWGRAV
ncbi:MAG: nucleoside-diphosphate kinase [bacterium]|nr:nucleoside-diphosphate kinase [bacterium]